MRIRELGEATHPNRLISAFADDPALTDTCEDVIERVPPSQGRLASHRDILADRQRLEQLHLLEGASETTSGSCRRSLMIQPTAVHPHRSRALAHEARTDIEQRRLAGAVRTDQTCDPPDGNLQADPVVGDKAPEPHGHVFHPQAGSTRSHRPRVIRNRYEWR